MYGMTPNMQIGIGVGVAALALVLFSPKERGLVMKFLTPSPKPDPVPSVPTIPGTTALIPDDQNIHQMVTSLMLHFAATKDEKGVALATAIGQHLYEEFAKTIEKANTPIPIPDPVK